MAIYFKKSGIIARKISNIFNYIFIRHPARTSLGILFGCIVDLFLALFLPSIKSHSGISNSIFYYNLSDLDTWEFILFFIFVFNIPLIISSFRNKKVGNEEIDRVIDLIERGSFTKDEKRRQYRKLIERMMKNIESENIESLSMENDDDIFKNTLLNKEGEK